MKLVIQNTSSVWGGNEKWLGNVATGLASRGHDVVVSCRRGPVEEGIRERGIRTSRFRPRGSVDLASGASFAGWLALEKPDTLLLTSWHSVSWSTFAARAAGVERVVLRNGIVRKFPQDGARSKALRSVHAIIANSDEVREVWEESAPRSARGRVTVVLNGVEAPKMPRAEARTRLRRELDLDDTTLLVGGAGHLFPRKGFDFLLRAFKSAGLEDARVAIAGDGEHLPSLQRLAAELGIADRVHWLGHRADGPEILAGLDLFVLSSHNEGMANVMLEAMSGGTPVIASDVSGVRKALSEANGRAAAGWIVPPSDGAALSAAISSAVALIRSDSDEVGKRVEEARWRIDNWFSMRRMIDECEAILFHQ